MKKYGLVLKIVVQLMFQKEHLFKEQEGLIPLLDSCKESVISPFAQLLLFLMPNYAPIEGDSTHLYACLDIIAGRFWKPYVLEAGLFSGGFATLTKIDGEPLQSIGDIFIPGQILYLRRQTDTRGDSNLKTLAIFDQFQDLVMGKIIPIVEVPI